MKRLLAPVLLLVIASAAASPDAVIEAHVSALAARAATLEGALVALASDPLNEQGPPLKILELVIRQGTVETDYEVRNTTAAGLISGPSESWTKISELADTSAESPRAGRYAYYFIAPLEAGARVRLESESLRVASANEDRPVSHEFALSGRDTVASSAEPAQTIRSAVESHVTVEGAFLLVLWDVDFVMAEGGDMRFPSGEERQVVVPGPHPDVRGVERVTLRQTYTRVLDGVLDMVLLRPQAVNLVVRTEAAHGAEITLHDAFGTLHATGSTVNLAGEEVTLTGAPTASIMTTRTGLQVQVSGIGGSAEVGGQTMTFAAPTHDAASLWWLLVLLVLPLGLAVRRGHYARLLRFLEDRSNAGDFDTIAKRAPRLGRSRRHRADALVMQAVALLNLGDAAGALECLERAGWPKHTAGIRHLLFASAHARLGRDAVARHHAEQAVTLDPLLWATVKAGPLFRLFNKQDEAWLGQYA
jgi:hypothetical protein